MRRPTKRFTPTNLSEMLVPALLIILAIALLVTILVVGLSLAGVTPG